MQPISLSVDRVVKRAKIAKIWREMMNPPQGAELIASEAEWAFWEALMEGTKPVFDAERHDLEEYRKDQET